MPIIFDCPQCGREIRVRSEAAGQIGRCTTCEARIMVPDGSEFGTLVRKLPSSAAALGSTSDLPNGFLKEATEHDAELWLNRQIQKQPPTS